MKPLTGALAPNQSLVCSFEKIYFYIPHPSLEPQPKFSIMKQRNLKPNSDFLHSPTIEKSIFTYHTQTRNRNPNSPLMQWPSSKMKRRSRDTLDGGVSGVSRNHCNVRESLDGDEYSWWIGMNGYVGCDLPVIWIMKIPASNSGGIPAAIQ